jgi:Cdc37 Hsp90 binding domain
LSVLARSFAGLGLGNYLECSYFITDNPDILAKSEIDALVAEAAAAERAGESTRAQTYIHQALLLRRCNKVGPNNVGSFFRDLDAKDRRTKESFVNDVKKVYSSIQQQAGRTSEQRQGHSSEPQGQKSVVVLQPIERTVSQNSYASTEDSEETTQSQTPVAFGEDGKLYYTDTRGNLLHPASHRRDSERHRSQSDPTDLSGSVPADPSETSTANGRGRHGAGRIHRPAACDPPGPLPTVPEHRKYESTRIGGTTGNVEILDQRECFANSSYPILNG